MSKKNKKADQAETLDTAPANAEGAMGKKELKALRKAAEKSAREAAEQSRKDAERAEKAARKAKREAAAKDAQPAAANDAAKAGGDAGKKRAKKGGKKSKDDAKAAAKAGAEDASEDAAKEASRDKSSDAGPRFRHLRKKRLASGKGATPREIGESLVALFNAGKADEAERTWYHRKIESIEGDGSVFDGLKGVAEKSAWWTSQNTVVAAKAEGPFVCSTGFTVLFTMTIERNGERSEFREAGVYTVEKGRIVREQFMYA